MRLWSASTAWRKPGLGVVAWPGWLLREMAAQVSRPARTLKPASAWAAANRFCCDLSHSFNTSGVSRLPVVLLAKVAG